jgi:hypothetical protein
VENITLSDTYIESKNTMPTEPITEVCAERETREDVTRKKQRNRCEEERDKKAH